MKKIMITIGIIALAALGLYVSSIQNSNDVAGEITIVVVNQIDEIIIEDTLAFEESDTLYSVMDENYQLLCANASYQISDDCENRLFNSKVIMQIESVVTDWNNNFIAIYVNDVYSNNGIDNIPLNDGDIIRFEYTLVGEENTDGN